MDAGQLNVDRSDDSSLLPPLVTAMVASAAGAVAFAVGFAGTYLVESRRIRSPSEPVYEFRYHGIDSWSRATMGPSGPLPSPYEFVAWQYHGLHRVGLRLGETPAPPRYLVFVPILLLTAAGAVVVVARGAERPATAAARGSSVTLGYAPLAVLTAETSAWNPPDSVTVVHGGLERGTDPLHAVGVETGAAEIVTWIAFPVFFGALGATAAVVYVHGDWRSSALRRGVAFGASAFAVGWAATFAGIRAGLVDGVEARAFEVALARGPYETLTSGAEPSATTVATWRHQALHGASLEVRRADTVTDQLRGGSVLTGEALAFLLPMVLVGLAGAAVVARSGVDDGENSDAEDGGTAAAYGATVVLGYLPLSLLLASLATWSPARDESAVFGVAFVDAVLLTGFAVPVAFGALGGVLFRWHQRRAVERSDGHEAADTG